MSINSGTILVPIGFTDQSIVALQQAVQFAKRTNSQLHLLSVIELPSAFAKLFSDSDSEISRIKDLMSAKLDEVKNTYCSDLDNVNCIVSTGKIYAKIIETAEIINASLIIMGTDGSDQNIKKKFIGSNALRVVRTASCPVITIKGEVLKNDVNKIILPLDLHKETKEKVTLAIEYARDLNSEIKVVSVLFNNDDFIKNKLIRNLNQVEQFISSKGIKCHSELIEVNAKKDFLSSIINYSNTENADLIMIMTQQESEYTLNFLGSNAKYLINHSSIPLVSVRPSQKRDMSGTAMSN